jgi:hypothetical protein
MKRGKHHHWAFFLSNWLGFQILIDKPLLPLLYPDLHNLQRPLAFDVIQDGYFSNWGISYMRPVSDHGANACNSLPDRR